MNWSNRFLQFESSEEDQKFIREFNERQFEQNYNVLDVMRLNPELFLSAQAMINCIRVYDKSM